MEFNEKNQFNEQTSKNNVITDDATVYLDRKTSKKFITWIIVSAVLAIIIAPLTGSIGFALIIFGQIFAGAGIFAFLQVKRKLENAGVLIFSIIGVSMVIAGLINLFGGKELLADLKNLVPFFILIVIFCAGLFFVIVNVISRIKKKERCTDYVKGVVAEIIREHSTELTRTYTPVYEYFYNGTTYRVSEPFSSNIGVPRVGQKVDIFVNPADPTDIYVALISRFLVPIFFGAMFMLISGLIMISMLL